MLQMMDEQVPLLAREKPDLQVVQAPAAVEEQIRQLASLQVGLQYDPERTRVNPVVHPEQTVRLLQVLQLATEFWVQSMVQTPFMGLKPVVQLPQKLGLMQLRQLMSEQTGSHPCLLDVRTYWLEQAAQ